MNKREEIQYQYISFIPFIYGIVYLFRNKFPEDRYGIFLFFSIFCILLNLWMVLKADLLLPKELSKNKKLGDIILWLFLFYSLTLPIAWYFYVVKRINKPEGLGIDGRIF